MKRLNQVELLHSFQVMPQTRCLMEEQTNGQMDGDQPPFVGGRISIKSYSSCYYDCKVEPVTYFDEYLSIRCTESKSMKCLTDRGKDSTY